MTADPFDLRRSLLLFAAATMFDGEDDDADDDEPDDDIDPSDEEADDDGTEDDDTEDDDSPPPAKKGRRRGRSEDQLRHEAARRRVENKALKQRIAHLEKGGGERVTELEGQVRELRLRLAFNDAARDAKVIDREAAWTLVTDDLAAVKVNDDGSVDDDRLGEIIAHVVQRYAYLVDADGDEPTTAPSDLPRVGPTGRGQRKGQGQTGAARQRDLARRFPALTGRLGR